MIYQYNMVQVPQVIGANTKDNQKVGNEAAEYLQRIVNHYAVDDWEFFRVDTIGVRRKPGCLGAIFGPSNKIDEYYVITFRRKT